MAVPHLKPLLSTVCEQHFVYGHLTNLWTNPVEIGQMIVWIDPKLSHFDQEQEHLMVLTFLSKHKAALYTVY